MATKNFLKKTMFMNIISVVVFGFGFAACSNDDCEFESNNNEFNKKADDPSQHQAYGLTYHNFDSANDVQILNNDTTEIAVKKSLADKLGIITFVNHPLGIWDAPSHLAYGRKAVEEKLIGDMYILKVENVTAAELIGDKLSQISTDVYVNRNVKNDGSANDIASKYTDEDGMIHPAVVLMTETYNNDYAIEGEQPVIKNSVKNGEYDYITAEDYCMNPSCNGSHSGRFLSFHNTINFSQDIPFGKGSGSSVNVAGDIPVDFDLNYFLTIEPGIRGFFKPYIKKFETGLNGNFGFRPNATISFKQKISLPEDAGKVRLARFNEYAFVFMVGPVPVAITIAPNLYLKFDASVSGAVKMGFQYNFANQFLAGVRYQNDKWSTLSDLKVKENKFTLNQPEVEVKAEAGVGLFLTTAVKIYGVAGPELGVGPRLGAEATLNFKPTGVDWSGKVDMKVQAWAGAKVEILGYELAEWSTRFDLCKPIEILKFPNK